MGNREAAAATALLLLLTVGGLGRERGGSVEAKPRRILLDTDVDTDDLFALLYLLKQNRSEFQLEAVTLSVNAWTDAGHSVNHIYDILFMMGRDDVSVGVGGEGGIKDDGTILPDVGGYHPLIEQGMTTAGYCRYRQAIPLGLGGRLDIDSNYGFRKSFLPQGKRRYSPLVQPTAQQVLINKVSAGPITLILIGAHTNIAIFLMSHPELKKNIEHIYVMGGGVRSKNPTGCCPAKATKLCVRRQCGNAGNLFTDYTSNPYAEFNMFGDPFAAYQVFHSGIPITLVPLDATNTIPITKQFFNTFQKSQSTYEAQYCFQSLKITRDTWSDNLFYKSYFMWDSFTSGVAVSLMRTGQIQNEFAEMQYLNITVITSNAPYGISDGSNPLFDGRKVPRFKLTKGGVHSGHIQKGLRDPFCIAKNGKGKCQDGYTPEVTGKEAVRVLVAMKSKPNVNPSSPLDREFYISFLNVLNNPKQSGKFNFTRQFPYYKPVLYKPNLTGKKLGKPVVFDMDMSAGDFLALFYLLKVPVEVIDLKAILVTPTGWANAATIDVVYDLLHMMGRDDIPVGLGHMFPTNQIDPVTPSVGDCKYVKAIPHGGGGFLDSDTLYGLARDLPRSPRRYTADNSVKHGAPRDTDHPNLRQPLALEVWDSIASALDPHSKISILTNGPLTTLADIIQSHKNTIPIIQGIYVVGGHINRTVADVGNVFTIPSNRYAEFNMFLDPLAAQTVLGSKFDITLIPLNGQRQVSSFTEFLKRLKVGKSTPESSFAYNLISTLDRLRQIHKSYAHTDIFLGEILGAVLVAADVNSSLKPTFSVKPVKVSGNGVESNDGYTYTDAGTNRKLITILENVNPQAFYDAFSSRLVDPKQSAVLGSFNDQARMWSSPPK